ncbi:hypothetical protein HMI56_001099 [Coelomomyces lativittatus]|nr:hypothetical protein HMI56_001099 [Coelomomyces lativittatus]
MLLLVSAFGVSCLPQHSASAMASSPNQPSFNGQLNQIPQTYASAGNLPVPGGQFGTRGTQITNIVRSALNISGV